MRRHLLVDTAVGLIYHSILVLSLYLLFAGHNQPGGGFVGGLVAGSALSLRYIAGGLDDVRSALPVGHGELLGGGLLIAALTAFVPVILGGAVLEHALFSAEVPLLGEVKATSALPFDVGVYLLVIGVTLAAFEAFGHDTDDGNEP